MNQPKIDAFLDDLAPEHLPIESNALRQVPDAEYNVIQLLDGEWDHALARSQVNHP